MAVLNAAIFLIELSDVKGAFSFVLAVVAGALTTVVLAILPGEQAPQASSSPEPHARLRRPSGRLASLALLRRGRSPEPEPEPLPPPPPTGPERLRAWLVNVARARWARLAVLVVTFVLLGLTVGMRAAPAVLRWVNPPECPVGRELLRVAVSPGSERIVSEAARAFAESRKRDGCRTVEVHVYPLSASKALEGLTTGWKDAGAAPGAGEDRVVPLRDIGPPPDVWVPDSSAAVVRVQAVLLREGRRDVVLESAGLVATSPLVVAMPEPVARALGWPGAEPDWAALLRRVGGPVPGSPLGGSFRLARPTPLDSGAGLLATVALYRSLLDGEAPDREHLSGVTAGLHRLESRVTPSGADTRTTLCELRLAGEDLSAFPAALIMEESLLLDYNLGRPLGGACSFAHQEPGVPLRAFYPSDGTPVLDHPFVRVRAAWTRDATAPEVDAFLAFLRGEEGQELLKEEGGLRGGDGATPSSAVVANGVLPGKPDLPLRLRDTRAVPGDVLAAWAGARRPARVLLAIDVSGSMRAQLDGGTRMAAARDAALAATDLIGDRDEIGLWEFSTKLDGKRDHRSLVPLGPAGERVTGGERRQVVWERLDKLMATRGDTGLYDTIAAGVARLDRGYRPDAVNALVVMTDGRNDDSTGGIGFADLRARLEARRDRQVHVFAIAFGEASCQASNLARLAAVTDGDCREAGPDDLAQEARAVMERFWGSGARL